ncbi:hypothetical protein, partial [Streptomyces mirabilis]|uniref:hypothetical protein n=1 Tax=Streptomyces mirabilis TaxID=68239 RepID=UPI003333A64B
GLRGLVIDWLPVPRPYRDGMRPRRGSEQRDESRGDESRGGERRGGERRPEGAAAERTGVRDADRGVCLGVSTGAWVEASTEASVEIGVNSPVPFVG